MQKPALLRSMKLVNYKGFENHLMYFRAGSNVLVGANNAGKSTSLGALRLVVAMLPTARRVAPSELGEIEGRPTLGWPITQVAIESSAFSSENIRHDFRPAETRIEVTITNGVKLIASWAAEDSDPEGPSRGMFFVIPPVDKFMKPRSAAQTLVPEVAVVPTLTPLEDREIYVSDETLRRHQSGRKASRYLRNSLWRLTEEEWLDFTSFVYERTPELGNLSIRRSMEDFDLFYEEERTRHEREIGWAGDGIQIWIQALFHLWRQRDSEVVVLDEPDVFLHPDLQRRLARTLFQFRQQTVVATHSVEILAEAEPGSVLWVDRSRRTSERPQSDGSLALMGRRLGSGFELGVGRALRSSTVLFVEGDDAPVLAHLARSLGLKAVSSSDEYATVPLGGFSKKWRASAFAETMAALGGSVRTFVILDSDLRGQATVRAETRELANSGARVHVWHRRELENYLLVPAAIAKVSGLSRADAEELLNEVVLTQKQEAFVALNAQRMEERAMKVGDKLKLSPRTFLEENNSEFEAMWSTVEGRLGLVDAKTTIRMLNTRLQLAKMRTLNSHSLAAATAAADVHSEVSAVLRDFDALVRGT